MGINESPVYVLMNLLFNHAQKDLPVTIYESGSLFFIETQRHEIKYSFMGESASKYPDDLIQSKKDTNIVVVLTGCKVRKFEGLPQLSTTVASQFHLNPRITDIDTYSQRAIDPIVFASTDRVCEDMTITSVPDILKRMVDGVDVGTRFVIEAVVIGVDVSKDWKYIQCTKCLRGVYFKDARYYCAFCNRNVTPRQAYRLVVRVYNNQEIMECVLFKDNAAKLLGCTVDELIARDSEEGAGDPDWIIDFFINTVCGLPVVFSIKVDKNNLEPVFSRRFTVLKYYGTELGVLNNVTGIVPTVVTPLLPVVANSPSTLDSDILDCELQSNVTECEEAMMDEVQWGPAVSSTTKVDECNMISDATMEAKDSNVGTTMEDEDKKTDDVDDSMVQTTIEVAGSNGVLESI